MKSLLQILFFLFSHLAFANMASPIREGTLSSSVFSSRDIDILKESIRLTINREFNTGFYVVEYSIKTDKEGKQIPLLFYARDYAGDFKIWVDNQPINLLEFPYQNLAAAGTAFEKFSSAFDAPSNQDDPETVTIYWEEKVGTVCSVNDLKYFETDLSKGEHTIRVEYSATAWTDVSQWAKQYTFRYSLSPARYWRSFGALEITVDGKEFGKGFTTNIGQPSVGSTDSTAVWNFQQLPSEFLQIAYNPKLNPMAKAFIAIGPTGMTIIAGIFLTILHLMSIRTYRASEPGKKYSLVVIAGSVIIPFFILFSYMYSFVLIDASIGPEAGGYHGYTFLIMIFYPILVPVYWLAMWLTDRAIKRHIAKAN